MTDDLEQIVIRARAGDLDAFSALVGRFQDFVYGLAYHLTHSFEDARDLTQDVFVRAFVRLDQLRNPAHFPQWLRQVTRSVCLSAMEARERRAAESLEGVLARGAEFPDPAPTPAVAVEATELREAVLRAVRRLPASYSLPLTLYYLNGLSSASVGEFLGLSPGAVRMRVHRALLDDLKAGDFAPDLTQIPSRWLGTYIADDLLEPLDDLLPECLLDRFIAEPDLLAACRWEGRLYALPLSSSVRALFRNTRFVDEAPRDWDELVAAAKRAGMGGGQSCCTRTRSISTSAAAS